jgi:hypothetical protein
MKNYIVVFEDSWNLNQPKKVNADNKDKAIGIAVDLASPYTSATIVDDEGTKYGTYEIGNGGKLFGIDFA